MFIKYVNVTIIVSARSSFVNKLVLSSSLKISVAARLEQLRGLRADSVVLYQNKPLGLPAPDKFEEIHKDSENSFDKLFAGQVVFDQRLDCNSPMEFRYYTKRFGANPDPVCFYCGSDKLSQSELEGSNCSAHEPEIAGAGDILYQGTEARAGRSRWCGGFKSQVV